MTSKLQGLQTPILQIYVNSFISNSSPFVKISTFSPWHTLTFEVNYKTLLLLLKLEKTYHQGFLKSRPTLLNVQKFMYQSFIEEPASCDK